MSLSSARTALPSPSPPGPVSPFVLVALCLGQFMVMVDVTVTNVAAPAMRDGLHASPPELQWIVDGYTTVFASLMLLGGGLGDRLGHRRLWLTGLVTFAAASAACALAPSTDLLIAARFAQGVGSALLIPASLALLVANYPDRAARARAIGVWGGVACTAVAAGPVAGGLLVDGLGWRAVFWLNLPVVAAAIVVTLRHIAPAPPRTDRARLDLAGQLLGVLALLALMYGLNHAGTSGWTSPPVLGAFGMAGALGFAFVLVERRRERGRPRGIAPVLPPSLFRRAPFAAAAVIGVLLNLGFYGMFYLIALYFQEVRGLSASATGLVLLPCMAMGILASPLAGRIGARTGPYLPMWLGLAFGATGFMCWLVAGPDTPYLALLPALVCSGIGTPLCMPAATSALLEAAPAEASGVASAVFNVARQSGSAIGVALFGTLAATRPISGLHTAAVIAAVLYAGGAVTAWVVGRRVRGA